MSLSNERRQTCGRGEERWNDEKRTQPTQIDPIRRAACRGGSICFPGRSHSGELPKPLVLPLTAPSLGCVPSQVKVNGFVAFEKQNEGGEGPQGG